MVCFFGNVEIKFSVFMSLWKEGSLVNVIINVFNAIVDIFDIVMDVVNESLGGVVDLSVRVYFFCVYLIMREELDLLLVISVSVGGGVGVLYLVISKLLRQTFGKLYGYYKLCILYISSTIVYCILIIGDKIYDFIFLGGVGAAIGAAIGAVIGAIRGVIEGVATKIKNVGINVYNFCVYLVMGGMRVDSLLMIMFGTGVGVLIILFMWGG